MVCCAVSLCQFVCRGEAVLVNHNEDMLLRRRWFAVLYLCVSLCAEVRLC